MALTQILVDSWEPRTFGFQHCFADGLNQSLVLSVEALTPLQL